MSRWDRGDCFGNAPMELFWGIDANRTPQPQKWLTHVELASSMADYTVNFYNPTRRRSSLEYLTPDEFEGPVMPVEPGRDSHSGPSTICPESHPFRKQGTGLARVRIGPARHYPSAIGSTQSSGGSIFASSPACSFKRYNRFAPSSISRGFPLANS